MTAIASSFTLPALPVSVILTNTAGDTVVAATSIGIFISTNSSTSWFKSTGISALSPTTSTPYFQYMSGDSNLTHLFTVGNNVLFHSTDKGYTWSTVSSATTVSGVLLSPDASTLYYAALAGTALYISTNLGITWTTQSSVNAPNINLACSTTGQYLYYSPQGTPNGYINYSSNYGLSFTQIGITALGSALGAPVYCNAAGNSVAYYGTGSTLQISSNYGISFNSVTGIALAGLSYDANNNINYISSGVAYSTTDYGLTITAYSVTSASLSRIANNSTSSYIYLSDSKLGVYRTVNSGTNWSLYNTFDTDSININSITSSDNGLHLYASGTASPIFHSSNYGQSWVSLNVGSNNYTNVSTDSSGQNVYTVYSTQISGQPPIVTGYLWKSTNYGVTWNVNKTTNSTKILHVTNSYNGQYVYTIDTSNAANPNSKPTTIALSYSSDNGTTWTNNTGISFGWTPTIVRCNRSSDSSVDGKYVIVIASNKTGTANAALWLSSNYGVSFSNSNAFTSAINAQTQTIVSCTINADGSIIAAYVGTLNNIYISTDVGATVTAYSSGTMTGTGGQANGYITCNATGNQLSIAYPTHNNIYTTTNTGVSWSSNLANSFWTGYSPDSWSTIVSNYTGSIISAGMSVGGIYTSSTLGETWYNSIPPATPVVVPCFLENTRILCLKDNMEMYVPIQDLRKGDLIKTLNSGYKALNMIGSRDILNVLSDERDKNKLYVCSKDQYPEVFEDLVITGCHSVLVDDLDDKERIEIVKLMGQIYVTDNMYRLPACIDVRTNLYDKEGLFTIYHIALDNDDYYMNYGVYANGLLVETCSKRYLRELSEMELIV